MKVDEFLERLAGKFYSDEEKETNPWFLTRPTGSLRRKINNDVTCPISYLAEGNYRANEWMVAASSLGIDHVLTNLIAASADENSVLYGDLELRQKMLKILNVEEASS